MAYYIRRSIICSIFLFIGVAVHAQNVGVNQTGSKPDSTAMLDVAASQKGFLLPRMTTPERDAISSPAQSLMIYNTTDSCLQVRIDTVWLNITCKGRPGCDVPPAPSTMACSDVDTNSFVAHWGVVSGASGYKLDVAKDSNFTSYASGYQNTSVATNLDTIKGLNCDSTYYYRVRAMNTCGASLNSDTASCTLDPCP